MADKKNIIKKVQAKFPIDLVETIEKSEGYKSMNDFLKRVSMRAVKYKKSA